MTDEQISENRILMESLDQMHEEMDTPYRFEHLKKIYDSTSQGSSVGQFEIGMSDYKQKILLVKKSIEDGHEINTSEKKGIICVAIQGLEKELLQTLRIFESVTSDPVSNEITEKLKHIDSLRNKYCDVGASIVDEVIDKL